MKLNKSTSITDSFKCPFFAFNNSVLSFKACIGRQITKTAYGEFMYPNCIDCKDGKKIKEFFSKHIPEIKEQKKNYNFKKLEDSKKAAKLRDELRAEFRGNIGSSKSKNHLQGKRDISNSIPPPATIQLLYDLEFLIKAQIAYLFSLAHEGKLDKAIKRIKLLNENVEG